MKTLPERTLNGPINATETRFRINSTFASSVNRNLSFDAQEEMVWKLKFRVVFEEEELEECEKISVQVLEAMEEKEDEKKI